MNNVRHWTVPVDHPAFAGHFPDKPILPGVVLLDMALSLIAKAQGLTLDQCEMGSVKFLSPVNPGDILAFAHVLSDSGTIRFDIHTAGRAIATGTLVAHAAS